MLGGEEPIVVAIGVSGGKDSTAVAIAVAASMRARYPRVPLLLIHCDLGEMEWRSSAQQCRQLAQHLALPLVIVPPLQRSQEEGAQGGLLEGFWLRWGRNLKRYSDLSCVKLIMPWSAPAMRFCTSDYKVTPICRTLVARYPGHTILSVTGVRASESSTREKMPPYAVQDKLCRVKAKTTGYSWRPLLRWREEDVWALLRTSSAPLHEAYTRYGSSRVSCSFCIMATPADLQRSAQCPDNAGIYRSLVELEAESAFSFQQDQWLGDIAPHLLTAQDREGLAEAKRRASKRAIAEARIPAALLYDKKGWPTRMITQEEAELLSEVRTVVAETARLDLLVRSPRQIQERYAFLLDKKARTAKGHRDDTDDEEETAMDTVAQKELFACALP
jgi:3'-phosphoadenosine 5'-phosphosulfate sulfotransferase (PAPS reductase)/FAD synthetase